MPAAAARRQALVDVVRRVYDAHGFVPLGTPAIEHWDALVGPGGTEANQLLFGVEAGEGDELGLRFDLTVPLARVVAANQQTLPRPLRRYQVGPVWRLDKPGPGRFREFVQFDADIVGTVSPVADGEVVAALHDVFVALLPDDADGARFAVRLSDRRILDALLVKAEIPPERGPDVLRVLDKLDRVGMEKVALELTSGYTDESGDPVPGLGLGDPAVAVIRGFLALGGPSRAAVFSEVERFLDGVAGAAERLAGVRAFLEVLDALSLPEHRAVVDLSIARGLAYYTGPVFEVGLRDAESFGSVGSGGRYDDLVSRFSGQAWPGVGVSVGVDRLLAALDAAGEGPEGTGACPDVLVTIMDRDHLGDYAAMASELRAAGFRVDLYAGALAAFGKQLKYADRLGVPVVVIAGGDEFAAGVVTVKAMDAASAADVDSREEWLAARFGQRQVPRADLAGAVGEALASVRPGAPRA